MSIHFNLFNIILLLGTLQGLILSMVLLLPGTDKRQSKYFLAAFMLVLAYNSFGTFCWSAGFDIPWLGTFDSLFPYTFIFSVGSSFYLYIKTTIEPGILPAKTIFKTYLPAVIDLIFRLCLFIYLVLNRMGLFSGLSAGKIDALYRPIAMVLMVVVFWYYLIAAIRLFKNLQTQPAVSASPAEQSLITKWTRVLLITMTLIAIVWAATIFSSVLFSIDGLGFFAPIEIILVIFVYWIGLRGYQLTRVVYISEQKATITYAESLGSKEIEVCIGILRESMERDKLFLDPALTVNKLAEKLDLNPRTISAVLNREIKKGFSEFVNEYRVKEVKEKMLQPVNKHLTIAGIAFESGFNSVATFQRTFKSIEHITPKQFLAINQNTDK